MTSDTSQDLIETANRTESWCGEPFLQPDEDAAVALASGTARRAALDDAIEEMDAGRASPSYDWRVRYGLMLGLERVLRESQPRTAAGTELRRHQVDALAGMLTELIASTQRSADENGNGGNGAVAEVEVEEEEVEDDFDAGFVEDKDLEVPDEDVDPERSAATASGIPLRRGRRSPRPGSSRHPAIWACSSSRTEGFWSRSSSATSPTRGTSTASRTL